MESVQGDVCSGGAVDRLDHTDALRALMRRLRSDIITHDVIFLVGPDAVRIGAHRNVVKCASEPLGAMLYSEMREGREKEVELPAVDPKSFRQFLDYIYTGELELDVASAVHLHKLADMYDMSTLRDACWQLTQRTGSITWTNACDVLDASLRCGDDKLVKSCLKCIALHGKESLERPEFANISVQCAELILGCDDLRADESDVLNAFLRFAKHADRDGCPRNPAEVQQIRGLIRLPLLPVRQLMGVADECGFFPREELFAAAKYQICPDRVLDTAGSQFTPRCQPQSWKVSQSMQGKVALEHMEKSLKKIGPSNWDVLARVDAIAGKSFAKCSVRIDHINDSDATGFVIGVVHGANEPQNYSSCRGLGGAFAKYNLSGQGEGKMLAGDIVTICIDVETREVSLSVQRAGATLVVAQGTFPADWIADDVSVGVFLHHTGNAVTII